VSPTAHCMSSTARHTSAAQLVSSTAHSVSSAAHSSASVGAARTGTGRRPAIAVAGVSTSAVCGVRDHACLLARELERRGAACSFHWLTREHGSMRAARSELTSWTHELARELERERPRAILLHYSVFSYSHRGVPLFVRPVLRVLERPGVPVLVVLHELAYPWRLGGWRGKVWSLSQRLALRAVLAKASAVIVTADFQAEWLRSRAWAPKRPLRVAPVFSNLPAPTDPGGRAAGARAERERKVIGVFGYAYEGVARGLVLDALGLLRDRGLESELRLLGAPGPSSQAARDWIAEAGARRLADTVSFTGTLPAQELSDALAACDLLLFPDSGGPSSRKGSLAGALGSGRPVVAIDGRHTWQALTAAGAATLAPTDAPALAEILAQVLGDAGAADELGARGRRFAQEVMGVGVTADAVEDLLAGAPAAAARP
jgi:glycosyltransferase involved in cell wall biosynthesis